MYSGQNGKPFLIWWFETPKNNKVPNREIETNINNSQNHNFSDTTEIELNATHQLFLDFILHGNTSVILSMPVLQNETLVNEINNLKKIANTLNVYGSYIDLKASQVSDRLIQYGPGSNSSSFTIRVWERDDGTVRVTASGWGSSVIELFDGPTFELLDYLRKYQVRQKGE